MAPPVFDQAERALTVGGGLIGGSAFPHPNLPGWSLHPDGTGTFKSPRLPLGQHVVTVESVTCSSPPGGDPIDQPPLGLVQFSTTGDTGETVHRDIDITNGAGRVTGTFALFGLPVHVGLSLGKDGGQCDSIESNVDGNLDALLPPGTYSARLTAISTGKPLGTTTVSVTAGETTSLGELRLAPTSSNVRGTVYYDGQPVGGSAAAGLHLGGDIPGSVALGADGTYAMPDLPWGTYVGRVLACDAVLGEQSFDVVGDSDMTVDFDLTPNAGRVVATITVNGNPVAGAYIWAFGAACPLRTDAQGTSISCCRRVRTPPPSSATRRFGAVDDGPPARPAELLRRSRPDHRPRHGRLRTFGGRWPRLAGRVVSATGRSARRASAPTASAATKSCGSDASDCHSCGADGICNCGRARRAARLRTCARPPAGCGTTASCPGPRDDCWARGLATAGCATAPCPLITLPGPGAASAIDHMTVQLGPPLVPATSARPCGAVAAPSDGYEIEHHATDALACLDVEVAPTVNYTGSITVCVFYADALLSDGVGGTVAENLLELYHDDGSGWQKVTPSNAGANELCGAVTSMSPFAMMAPADVKPPVFGNLPPNPLIAYATSAAGATVSYAPTAVDAVDGSVPVHCSRAPGVFLLARRRSPAPRPMRATTPRPSRSTSGFNTRRRTTARSSSTRSGRTANRSSRSAANAGEVSVDRRQRRDHDPDRAD